MAKEFNRAAVLHLIAGTLEKREEVPVGVHDVSGARVIFTLPSMAVVTRGEGNGKDKGTNERPAPPLALTMDAVLLFLERSEIKGGARTRKRWADAIRDSLAGTKAETPAEAVAGLAKVQAEQPKAASVVSKAPAQRTGADQVAIVVEAGA